MIDERITMEEQAAVLSAADTGTGAEATTPLAAVADDTAEGQERITIEELQERVALLSHKVRQRTGRALPVLAIQVETLLDMILAPNTEARDTFERLSMAKALVLGESMLQRSARDELSGPGK